jgi:hypothetical protein
MTALANSRLKTLPILALKKYLQALGEHLPLMLSSCQAMARRQLPALSKKAIHAMEDHLHPEVTRLQELSRLYHHSNTTEIKWRLDEIQALRQCLSAPALRMDALRLVLKNDN